MEVDMVAPKFAAGPRRTILRDSRLAALALLLSIPACYSWHRVELARTTTVKHSA